MRFFRELLLKNSVLEIVLKFLQLCLRYRVHRLPGRYVILFLVLLWLFPLFGSLEFG